MDDLTATTLEFVYDNPAGHPDPAAGALRLGTALLDVGQPHEAEASLRRAARLEPVSAGVRETLGRCLKAQVCYDEAVRELRIAVLVGPGRTSAHNNLGILHHMLGHARARSGRVPEAIHAYHRAARLTPEDPEPWYYIATCFGRLGRCTTAVACARRYLEARPGSAEAHAVLALLLSDRGRHGEAVSHAQPALLLAPDGPTCQTSLEESLRRASPTAQDLAPAA